MLNILENLWGLEFCSDLVLGLQMFSLMFEGQIIYQFYQSYFFSKVGGSLGKKNPYGMLNGTLKSFHFGRYKQIQSYSWPNKKMKYTINLKKMQCFRTVICNFMHFLSNMVIIIFNEYSSELCRASTKVWHCNVKFIISPSQCRTFATCYLPLLCFL